MRPPPEVCAGLLCGLCVALLRWRPQIGDFGLFQRLLLEQPLGAPLQHGPEPAQDLQRALERRLHDRPHLFIDCRCTLLGESRSRYA